MNIKVNMDFRSQDMENFKGCCSSALRHIALEFGFAVLYYRGSLYDGVHKLNRFPSSVLSSVENVG